MKVQVLFWRSLHGRDSSVVRVYSDWSERAKEDLELLNVGSNDREYFLVEVPFVDETRSQINDPHPPGARTRQ